MKKEKKIFDFAKYMGEIDDRFIKEAEQPWKKKRVAGAKKFSKKIVAAVLVICLGVGASAHPAAKEALREFTGKIGYTLGIKNNLEPYTKILNTAKTKKGITVKLKEVIVDENRLLAAISYDKETNDEKEQEISFCVSEKTRINGKKTRSHSSGTYSLMGIGDESGDTHEPAEEVLSLEYKKIKLPKTDMNIELSIDAYNGESFQPVEEFTFSFTISAAELERQTIKQVLGMQIYQYKDFTVQLKKLRMNSLTSEITTKVSDDIFNGFELMLKGTDSHGNVIRYVGGQYNKKTKEIIFATDFFGPYEEGEVVEVKDWKLGIPDTDSQYLDLQLYGRRISWNVENNMKETEIIDEEEIADYIQTNPTDAEYSGMTEKEFKEMTAGQKEDAYGWIPMGERFIISISK